jgi:membrane protein implicated in regulation of membrane protease activity
MTVMAHAGHWLIQIAYFAPVVLFLIWLAVTVIRDRRSEDDAASHDSQ